MQRIPLWLKIGCTIFLAVWIPVYWQFYGPQNFLWFCDLANFLIVLALWLENSLLLSSQGVSILLIQVLWALDVLGRLAFGFHPIGGTEYMFDPAMPAPVRLFSLFHIISPPLVLWGIWRLGYNLKGWLLQTGIAWFVLPLCYVYTEPEKNINWVRGLFGKPQTLVNPHLYLAILLIGYPLIVYLPTHMLLKRFFPGKGRHRPR